MEDNFYSINQTCKQTLCPNNVASKGLKTLYLVFKIFLVYLAIAAGVIIFLVSLFQEDPYVRVGVLYGLNLILIGFINLLFLQFINSLIVRTRAAEYYNAIIESKYDVK